MNEIYFNTSHKSDIKDSHIKTPFLVEFTQKVNEGGVNQGRKPELIDGTKPSCTCKNLQWQFILC